jgi:hypothetical protein
LLAHNLFEPEIFRDFTKGDRYGLWITPKNHPVRGVILAIQTTGEENNFSRHVIVQAANRFAQMGFATLVFEPYGVGDSAGKSSEIRLREWRSDFMRISHKIRMRFDVPFYIWGTRLGTLLAADLLISQSDNTAGLLMWAPLAHGRTWVESLARNSNSFTNNSRASRSSATKQDAVETRSLMATSWNTGPASKVVPELEDTKADLGYLDGALYRSSLLEEITNLSLAPVKRQAFSSAPQVAFFGAVPPDPLRTIQSDLRLPPSIDIIAKNWRNFGYKVHASAIACEKFWATMTTYPPLALFEASEAWLASTLESVAT